MMVKLDHDFQIRFHTLKVLLFRRNIPITSLVTKALLCELNRYDSGNLAHNVTFHDPMMHRAIVNDSESSSRSLTQTDHPLRGAP